MDVDRRRSVVAGSVWESRMKIDEVRGGMKVFKGEEERSEESGPSATNVGGGSGGGSTSRLTSATVASSGKRKTWKSESFDGFEKSPFQISKRKPEPLKNSEEHCKELTVSAEGIKKSPVQARKLRSEASKEVGVSVEKFERSPIQMRKPRSEPLKEPNSAQLRKVKSDSVKGAEGSGNGTEQSSSIQLRKAKSELSRTVDEPEEGIADGSVNGGTEKSPVNETGTAGSDETCKEVGVCQEKVITGRSVVNYAPEVMASDDEGNDLDVVDVDDEEETDEETDSDVKKINVPEPKKVVDEEENVVDEEKKLVNEEKKIVNEEKKIVNDEKKIVNEQKKIVNEEKKPVNEEKKIATEEKKLVNEERKIVNERKKIVTEEKKLVNEQKKIVNEEKKPVNEEKKIANEEKRLHQVSRKPVVSVKQPPPLERRRTLYQDLSKPTPRSQNFSKPTTSSYEFQTFPETHSKLQSFVDLIMWKEVPRSALVLLIGSFFILSSSYTKDVNLSFISVTSYMGLVYLSAIFIYRSLICRGVVYTDDSSCVLGEQEAMWLLRLVLPYVNELLLKLRALFSGHPATTMKLAVLLFVLARCGSCLTIWTVIKLGFLGVFTVPKLCSLYSSQLTAIAKFWVRRFHDIWDSCSHKKAVASAIVFLVLNLSSTVARIWEVFMLYVAFRCYQQSGMRYDWVEDEAGGEETS
ncbi:reticulon-like protein B21 isoform X2 [Juglans microcarpa x Juglans regia]|uniref:reticulon-like protein B21 isoform X2 n=1 Tax=Juglans microcarpa x Juglans regia TaxID=2249226 RepID=UPI001B7F0C22|nr:reticulon-like protein B21 isoform X2 [Juglans microcarpa x Juglans regia]